LGEPEIGTLTFFLPFCSSVARFEFAPYEVGDRKPQIYISPQREQGITNRNPLAGVIACLAYAEMSVQP
jgi:hypothetical protein